MDAQILHPHPHAVKHGRFVAPTPEAQAAEEAKVQRQIGRNYYRRGYDLDACTTDAMTQGWLACEAAGERFGWQLSKAARGEQAYYAEMARDGAARFVNWNSGAEGGW